MGGCDTLHSLLPLYLHNPALIGGHDGCTGAPDLLGLLGVLLVQPLRLGDDIKVNLPVDLLEVAHPLAKLLRQRLILDIVEEKLGVGYHSVPLLRRRAWEQGCSAPLQAQATTRMEVAQISLAITGQVTLIDF